MSWLEKKRNEAISSTELPLATEIALDMPGDPQDSGYVRIYDENDYMVRE